MLLPSILQMLDQCREQPDNGATARVPSAYGIDAAGEGASERQREKPGIDEIPRILNPLSSDPQLWDVPPGGPCLEELLRAVAKFENPDQSRFLDVFE